MMSNYQPFDHAEFVAFGNECDATLGYGFNPYADGDITFGNETIRFEYNGFDVRLSVSHTYANERCVRVTNGNTETSSYAQLKGFITAAWFNQVIIANNLV